MSEKLELGALKTRLMSEIRTEKGKLSDLKAELDSFETSRESSLLHMKEMAISVGTADIMSEYRAGIDDLTARRDALSSEIESVYIDDSDESVSELREKREYLNQVAIEVEKLHAALLLQLTDYYISLAYSEKVFPYKRMVKEIKRIPGYVRDIQKQKHGELFSLKFKELLQGVGLPENLAIWIVGVIGGSLSCLLFPYVVVRGIRRAGRLHNHARRYHMLVQTAYELQDRTSTEIVTMLEGVLITRKDTLVERLQAIEDELEKVTQERNDKISEIHFDEEEANAEISRQVFVLQQEIEKVEDRIDELQEQLDSVTASLDELLGEEAKRHRLEREPFINPANEERSVVLPTRFLYDYTEKNRFLSFTSGLYVYTSRLDAEAFVRTLTYQLRNYMRFGTLNIYVLDVMMGSCVADLVLGKKSDIKIDSMRDDQATRIELLHDIMTRRHVMIKQSAQDIAGYNRIQEKAGSAPLPYEMLFQFAEASAPLTEKIIQLFKVGQALGVYVFLFIHRELLESNNVRMYEKYVPIVGEISNTGISFQPPNIFRANFESEVKNRQD